MGEDSGHEASVRGPVCSSAGHQGIRELGPAAADSPLPALPWCPRGEGLPGPGPSLWCRDSLREGQGQAPGLLPSSALCMCFE